MLIAFFVIRGMCYQKLDEIDQIMAEVETMTAEPTVVISTPEPTPELTPEPIPEPTPSFPVYDLPLSEELQEYTYNTCAEYGVDYELVLALMDQESTFRVDVVSATNDYGLMQINKCNHAWLKEELGITDFLDPEQNILAGVYILSTFNNYSDMNKILMAYNMGLGGAMECWQQGIYSTAYSREVLSTRDYILSLQN